MCGMVIFIKWGSFDLNKKIYENIPNEMKLKNSMLQKMEKNPPRKSKKFKSFKKGLGIRKKRTNKSVIIKNLNIENRIKLELNCNNENDNNLSRNFYNSIKRTTNKLKSNNPRINRKFKSQKLNIGQNSILIDRDSDKSESIRSKSLLNYIKKKKISKKESSLRKRSSSFLFKNESNEKILNNITTNRKKSTIYAKNQSIKNKNGQNLYNLFNNDDDSVDAKELNTIPYTQALRIDNRSFFQILLSVLAHEIEIVDIFYYRNPFSHLSIILSLYIFECCLDLTLNCLLYTDDVVSEKYNNNGSIQFFTSLSLSFMSNIFAGIIAYILGKLAGYAEILEFIIKDASFEREYYLIIAKYKKYIILKLSFFYIIQFIINLGMCYYLMIFCTVYHNTQGSILINYIIGIAQSIAISAGLTITISLIRYLSLKNKWKNIYNTSKYFFEKF